MSKILARFKRSASTSSDHDDQVAPQSLNDSDDEPLLSLTSDSASSVLRSPVRNSSGTHFIEELGTNKEQAYTTLTTRPLSPSKQFPNGALTPSPSKRLELEVPDSLPKSQSIGTPKLVLTEEGSSSPRSFSSSPGNSRSSPSKRGLGLGLESQLEGFAGDIIHASPTDGRTDRSHDSLPVQQRRGSKSKLSINTTSSTENLSPTSPITRVRSDTAAAETRKHRSGSIISRLKGGSSPTLSPDTIVDGSGSRSVMEGKRHRRLSASSGKAKSIAAAIVGKGGHNVTSPTTPTDTNRHSMRLSVRGSEHGGSQDGDSRDGYDDEDEDDSGSELDDDLPVTGFAVASNRRNADFHAMFPAVDEGDYLIEDYGCALSKDILVQGRLYVSENHICFHANIFGWITDLVIPFVDIRLIEKKMTALVIPNAIGVSTGKERYTFASFISRDTTFDVMMNIWRLCNPTAVMSTASFQTTSRPSSVAGTDVESPTAEAKSVSKSPGKGHAVTHCSCGKEGKHYGDVSMDVTLPSTPEKIYNLMFTSEWSKAFMAEELKLKEIEMSDWRPVAEGERLLVRSMTYIKPLNGSIGPKQTKCHITDEQTHFDLDDFISTLSTTRTPDVPSGGVFSVKTRTCFTWAGGNSTRVLVTTGVEWTGKSWIKGIIEKSAVDGPRQVHEDLDRGMRKYMKEHQTEFGHTEEECDAVESPVEGERATQPTEAEAYAAQTRKKRHDEDLGYMQSGFDMVWSGITSIFAGLSAVFESIQDLISDAPVGKEVVFGSVIFLLVVSNIYTYFAFKSNAPVRRLRRAERENDLSEAVRLLIEQSRGGQAATPQQEMSDLLKILDDVEMRAAKLRNAVTSGKTINHEELD